MSSPRCLASLLAIALVLVMAGCGTSSDGRPEHAATLTLGVSPAAVHAGIELAVDRDFTGAEGVELSIAPFAARSEDPAALLATGRTDFALLDLHDLAIARAAGRDLVAVMAIVQDPLPAATPPQGSHGRPVDVTGAPPYPGLVLCVTRATLQDDPALVRATVHALQRGYRETLADPESAVETVLQAAPGTQRAQLKQALDAVQASFQAIDGTIGTFDLSALTRWATWERRAGIVPRTPDVGLMFYDRYARSGAEQASREDG